MGFLNILFPTDISYRSSGGPAWKTSISENDNGTEVAISKWSTPRCAFNAVKAVQKQAQLVDLIAFARITEGAAHSFRYKDWHDYTSTADGLVALDSIGDSDGRALYAIDDEDQPLGTGDASTTIFQMQKRYAYTTGTLTLEKFRPITKPAEGSVLVAVDGAAQTEGIDYTVDYSTGLVTFTSAPLVDEVLTCGFEFHVPCRFGEEFDAQGIPAEIVAFNHTDVSSVPIVEKKDTIPTDEQRFAGGTRVYVLNVSSTVHQVSVNDAKLITFSDAPAGFKVYLPDIANLPNGGELFVLRSVDSSNAIELWPVGGAGVKLADLNISSAVRVFKGLDASGTAEWVFV